MKNFEYIRVVYWECESLVNESLGVPKILRNVSEIGTNATTTKRASSRNARQLVSKWCEGLAGKPRHAKWNHVKKWSSKNVPTTDKARKSRITNVHCPKCGKFYKCRSSLSSHAKFECGSRSTILTTTFVSTNSPYTYCSIPVMSDYKAVVLPQHICENCGKHYKYNQNLKRHIKYECGKAPKLKCPECDYVTFYKYDLLNHSLLHSCNQCGKVYRYNRSLQRHLKFECGKVPSFCCPVSSCRYRAKQKSNLMSHICNKHSKLAIQINDLHLAY
ncbi:zinc finger protein 626-like [Planococcus citri]|uniref:zinc finger protein 626-like n=1 Tax=Planococcus citri TaxID=170843 RepID=UPI0031F72935